MAITITEALAEIKTLGKRMEKKREYIMQYLVRAEGMRDPLDREVAGGSPEAIRREQQGLRDMEDRIIALRRGIQRANDATEVTVLGETRSISDWLTWRRDVAPGRRAFLNLIRAKLNQVREASKRQGVNIISAVASTGSDAKPQDVVVNVDEAGLAAEIERMEDILGQLDGQLSLRNATVMIEA